MSDELPSHGAVVVRRHPVAFGDRCSRGGRVHRLPNPGFRADFTCPNGGSNRLARRMKVHDSYYLLAALPSGQSYRFTKQPTSAHTHSGRNFRELLQARSMGCRLWLGVLRQTYLQLFHILILPESGGFRLTRTPPRASQRLLSEPRTLRRSACWGVIERLPPFSHPKRPIPSLSTFRIESNILNNHSLK